MIDLPINGVVEWLILAGGAATGGAAVWRYVVRPMWRRLVNFVRNVHEQFTDLVEHVRELHALLSIQLSPTTVEDAEPTLHDGLLLLAANVRQLQEDIKIVMAAQAAISRQFGAMNTTLNEHIDWSATLSVKLDEHVQHHQGARE